MKCEQCGGEWWVEEKIILLAGSPAADVRFQTTAREVNYRLKCAGCGKLPTAPASNPVCAEPKEKKPNENGKTVARK